MTDRTPLSVLHIGTERRWRGGENQIRLFVEHSAAEVRNVVAYPRGSRGLEVFANLTETLPLASANPTSLTDVIRLRNFCVSNGIDIIDANSGNAHTIALLACHLGARSRVVVHRRVASALKSGLRSRWKYQSKYVARFVAISQFIESALLAYGIPGARVAMVRSGVAMQVPDAAARTRARAALAARFGFANDTVLIGNASALTKEKGYPVLLDAIAELRRHGDIGFHCFIAGDGPLRDGLDRQRRALGIESHVSFLGHLERIDEFLPALDILAMPSEREGLGTLLLDATLAGCALAASEVGGMPEIVHHGETGLLSAPGDARGHAANLRELALAASLRRRLNLVAVDLIRRDFSVEQMVAGNLAVYRAVQSETVRR